MCRRSCNYGKVGSVVKTFSRIRIRLAVQHIYEFPIEAIRAVRGRPAVNEDVVYIIVLESVSRRAADDDVFNEMALRTTVQIEPIACPTRAGIRRTIRPNRIIASGGFVPFDGADCPVRLVVYKQDSFVP